MNNPHAYTDDIFESDCQAIVNTVNTMGVMGGGLALAFKNRYPDMYQWYRKECEAGNVAIGRMGIWQEPDDGYMVVNFPTKMDPRQPSLMPYVEAGLWDLRIQILAGNIPSVAIPPLGCGLGGLEWDKVEPLIKKYLEDLSERVDVYPPDRHHYTLDKKPRGTMQGDG